MLVSNRQHFSSFRAVLRYFAWPNLLFVGALTFHQACQARSGPVASFEFFSDREKLRGKGIAAPAASSSSSSSLSYRNPPECESKRCAVVVDDIPSKLSITRNGFLQRVVVGFSLLTGPTLVQSPRHAFAESTKTSEAITMFQLPSGIKYLDLELGSGPTPEYGQLCSIAYRGYIKLPANKNDSDPQPQQFDQSDRYLIKHGNGRTIPGLDEGLHTLKVGGTRRIIIPPKLGYIRSGLGPLPEYPWDRFRLNYLLDQMVALRGGTVVFEVTLLSAMDDEADQGYYQDGSLTPEQMEQLRNNLIQRGASES